MKEQPAVSTMMCLQCQERPCEPGQAVCASCWALISYVGHERALFWRNLSIVALIIFFAYRFWRLGWSAFGGNLRFLAIVFLAVGLMALLFGPSNLTAVCGAGSRMRAAFVVVVAVGCFLIAQSF
jgi:hypothetical protein